LFRIEVCPWHSTAVPLKLWVKYVILFCYLL
jgi:hypothetical protein